MTHTHTALLEIGQHTSRPVLEDYSLADQDGQDIDLANAQEVTMTTQHHATGLVETAAQPVEITDANNGEIRYQFGPEEIPLDGRYDVQFFIEYENGDTQAVPPGTGWFPFISVARKLPGEKMSARFSGLRVDELTAASFSADEIAPDVITGSIAGGKAITRLDGPDLEVNDNGELGWVDPTSGDYTAGSDHDHSATGDGGDTLRPQRLAMPVYTNADSPADTLYYSAESERVLYKDGSGAVHGNALASTEANETITGDWTFDGSVTGIDSGSSGAPTDASFVTIASESGLDAETVHADIAESNRHPPAMHNNSQHSTSYATTTDLDNHSHSLGDLSNVTASGEGDGGGLNADTVDGHHAEGIRSLDAPLHIPVYSESDPTDGNIWIREDR